MPVQGLPANLEVLLGALVEKCELKSWQIYNEKFGSTLKIRFGQAGQCTEPQTVSYAKKSKSRTIRDQKRMDNFISGGVQTRSRVKLNDSVEKPRCLEHSGMSDNLGLSPVLPSHIDDSQSPITLTSALIPSTPVRESGTEEVSMTSDQASVNTIINKDQQDSREYFDQISIVDGTKDDFSLHSESEEDTQNSSDGDLSSGDNTVNCKSDDITSMDVLNTDDNVLSDSDYHAEYCAHSGDNECQGCGMDPGCCWRTCTHVDHTTPYNICNRCFKVDGFTHDEHEDQLTMYTPEHEYSKEKYVCYCYACGKLFTDKLSTCNRCKKCKTFILCDLCFKNNQHKGHMFHFEESYIGGL